MAKKKTIPFEWLPGSWGLAGKTREIAKAEYYLEGYELEIKLLELESTSIKKRDYEKRLLDIELKHNKITEKEYYKSLAEQIEDPKQRAIALLEINHRDGDITELEFNKQSATIRGEPWVTVINMDFGGKGSLEGSFELDWNEQFVEKLKGDGYVGPTPDSIVNQWFMEVCRNVALEEFDGTGNFTADSEANLESVRRWNSESFPDGRKGYK